MSTTPGAYNIGIYQNATLNLVFIWSTGGACCTGTTTPPVGQAPTLVNLTGYTATMQFRNYYTGPLLFDASSYITLGGVAGTITLDIPASVTSAFTWLSAVYDLLLTDSSGNVTPLLAGNVTVTPGIST